MRRTSLAGMCGRYASSRQPEDLVEEFEITLVPEGAGTRLRVVESGFSDLDWPDHERARYADENAKGWIVELDELRRYAALATGAPGAP